MHDSAIIYIGLTLGFTLLVIVIRILPFSQLPNNQASMYYKFDLAEKKISTITFRDLKEETNRLFDKDYELIRLRGLKAFINHKKELPEKSFLVVLNDFFFYTLIKALPVLIKGQLTIIIFIPIFIVAYNNKWKKIQIQLNKYFFSENPKTKSGNTQLNSEPSTTI